MYQPPLSSEERLEVLQGLMRTDPFGLVISVGWRPLRVDFWSRLCLEGGPSDP